MSIYYRPKEWYSNKITSEHRSKPRFFASVQATLHGMSIAQKVMAEMIGDVDIDKAQGNQLDAVGKWVGFDRFVDLPSRGVYFRWSGQANEGWDKGVWWVQGDGTQIYTKLSDDVYRKWLKAKVKANDWDGNRIDGYGIIAAAYPALASGFVIEDSGNMSWTLRFDSVASKLSTIEILLIQHTFMFLKGAGIQVICSPQGLPGDGN